MIAILIIGTILILGSFIVLTMIGRANVKSDYDGDQRTGRWLLKLRYLISGGILALLAIIFLIASIKIIDSTEVGVVRTWGQINREISAGFNFINPISESVEKYDLKVHVRTAELSSYTKDAQAVEATVDYQYRLRPGEVMDVAREYGSYDILESKLAGVVEEKVKTVFSTYSAMPLLENRANLSPEVLDKLKTLQNLYHIEFTTAVVNNIDFSDAFEQSVEAKMTAEQEALRAEQEKKTALVKAEQQKEVAAINAEAAIAQAQGEAEAMRIIREALQNMPDAYIQQMWIDKWDGKLPTVQAGESSAIVVNPGVGSSEG